MRGILVGVVGSALLGAACSVAAQTGPEPIIGGPCEGCEAVFQGRPSQLSGVARIAPPDEPGEPMRIWGVVLDANGRPVSGVIAYAYHTNARGVYPPDERFPGRAAYRHGRLRGWARTDADGRYAFDTIRPGTYPDRSEPAHVHMHVIEPGCCTYYIDSIHFTDDPQLARGMADEDGRGGSGIVDPERGAGGVWLVRRDIQLGAGVPGHPGGADLGATGASSEPDRDGLTGAGSSRGTSRAIERSAGDE